VILNRYGRRKSNDLMTSGIAPSERLSPHFKSLAAGRE